MALNYHQFLSPMTEAICRECRALILEVGTWNVVAKSFPKFFNLGETSGLDVEAAFNWGQFRVMPKLDGSLITFYHYQGEWRASTRSRPDASGPVGEAGTFRDLIEIAVQDQVQRVRGFAVSRSDAWAHFTAQLSPEHSYGFELTAPENRVVCSYENRALTLLTVWNLSTLTEEPTEAHLCWLYPIVGAEAGHTTLETITARLAKMNWWEEEGFVLQDDEFRRLKVKSPAYLLASHAVTSFHSDKQKVGLILSGQMDDALAHLPVIYIDRVEKLLQAVKSLIARIEADYAAFEGLEDQKSYAMAVKDRAWAGVLFNRRKGIEVAETLTRMGGEKVLALLVRAGLIAEIAEIEANGVTSVEP